MAPRVVAAIGGVAIGLIAGAVGSDRGVRNARPGAERRYVLLWSAAFSLAIATFIGGLPLVPPAYRWLLAGPFVTIPLAVFAVNRAPAKFRRGPQHSNG
jgi:hypothetical protein